MPNSAACLIELMVSPPALARPMICAFEACACSRNEEKSVAVERMTHLAQHLAAVRLDDRRGVALQRVAEGVVGGEEEPGLAAGLHDRLAGAVGERPGVVGPVDGVGRALVPVRSEAAAPETRNTLFFSRDDLVDGERHRRVRHVDDHVDLVDVDPLVRRRWSRRPACSGGRRRRPRPSVLWRRRRSPRPPSARRPPSPGRRDRHRVPDMSFITPILMTPSVHLRLRRSAGQSATAQRGQTRQVVSSHFLLLFVALRTGRSLKRRDSRAACRGWRRSSEFAKLSTTRPCSIT